MKNFNIILIACLAFIFLSSSGCSKEEESPYKREQIIGKWFYKSLWEMDNSGDGEWIDIPILGKYIYNLMMMEPTMMNLFNRIKVYGT